MKKAAVARGFGCNLRLIVNDDGARRQEAGRDSFHHFPTLFGLK